MKKLLIILILALSTLMFADKITINDGRELEECTILGKRNNCLFISWNEKQYKLDKSDIKSIRMNWGGEITSKTFKKNDWGNINPNNFENLPQLIVTQQEVVDISKQLPKYNYVAKPIPLCAALVSGYLAFDYFSEADEISKQIEETEKYNDYYSIEEDKELDRLESRKSRKIIGGVVFSAVAVLNTFFTFEKVEIQTTDKTIGLSYKF